MKKETWIFMSFMDDIDARYNEPYFVKIFHDHAKMKVFSAKHSAKEKKKHPNYVSDYTKLKEDKQ